MSPTPTYQHDCTICGQANMLVIGELHDCPGFPGLFPATKFEPAYSFIYRAGHRAATAVNEAFWKAFLKGTA